VNCFSTFGTFQFTARHGFRCAAADVSQHDLPPVNERALRLVAVYQDTFAGWAGHLVCSRGREREREDPLHPPPQDALPLCAEAQCDVGGRYRRSLGAAGALCAALRAEHACLLKVNVLTSLN